MIEALRLRDTWRVGPRRWLSLCTTAIAKQLQGFRSLKAGATAQTPAPTRAGSIHSEESFRYLLSVEGRRSARSDRPFLLLLVDMESGNHTTPPFDADTAQGVFAALGQSVRETDFIGWYRQDKVAAAFLSQFTAAPGADGTAAVIARVRAALDEQLSSARSQHVQVRVYELPSSRS